MGARYSKRKGNRKIANANRDSIFNTFNPIHQTIIIKRFNSNQSKTIFALPYYKTDIVHKQIYLIIGKGKEQKLLRICFYDT